MEQNRPAPRRALSPKERRRRHRIRLVRNWTVFLLSCGAVMAVMTGGILWLLPRAYASSHRRRPSRPGSMRAARRRTFRISALCW